MSDRVALEVVRLGFSLVWLGLIWYGWFPCLEKMTGKTPADKEKKMKSLAANELAWRRLSKSDDAEKAIFRAFKNTSLSYILQRSIDARRIIIFFWLYFSFFFFETWNISRIVVRFKQKNMRQTVSHKMFQALNSS